MENKYGKVNADKKKTDVKKPMPVYVKYGIAAVILLVAIVGATLIWFNAAGSYVAKVGDLKIGLKEYNYYLEMQKDYMLRMAQSADPNVKPETFWTSEIGGQKAIDMAKKSALDGIRDVKIMLSKAKEAKTSLTSDEKKNIENGIKSYYIDPEQLGGGNRVKANKVLMSEYGFGIDDIQKIQEENYLVQKYTNEKYKVTDAEIKDYYEKNPDWYKESTEMRTDAEEAVWARHILILADKDATQEEKDAAKKKAQDLLDKLTAGEDFATLAKANSEDPGSAKEGGDYMFGKGRMVPEFENAAFSLSNGQLYKTLVQTDYGYHIIKLEEKYAKDQPVSLKCATEYRDYGINFIINKRYQKALEEFRNDTKYQLKNNDPVYNEIK